MRLSDSMRLIRENTVVRVLLRWAGGIIAAVGLIAFLAAFGREFYHLLWNDETALHVKPSLYALAVTFTGLILLYTANPTETAGFVVDQAGKVRGMLTRAGRRETDPVIEVPILVPPTVEDPPPEKP